MNGPCGGMEDSHCEVDEQRDCTWIKIYRRLEKQQRQGVFEQIVEAKDWSKKFKPGRHQLVRNPGAGDKK